ncbi:MAG: DUF4080 domain-containing protein, partial [Rhodoferax sp.]|nr:DUF4080 domain-containing protein [Rhodoferax sp.]
EFTIQRPPQQIVDALLLALGDSGVRVVGFGVYIWNVVQTTAVIRLLKEQCPQVKVVLGGPEVSHEWEQQEIVRLADHLITGWGDVSFPKLCRALVHGPQPLMKVMAGEQPALEELALPYDQYSATDLAQRVLYVEASRGCPFKCAFCLSALDKTAWAFELDAFLGELATLYARGARAFKFVDRTFNLKVETSVRILQFFLDRLQAAPQEPLHLHFELVPDHLPDALKTLVAQFPAGVLQFEIGIQSFSPDVQARIARRQDNQKTADNIGWLLAHTAAHLHTDLIFGLPGESWDSFAAGFDRLYALGPHEIQLGLLKRLRGTPLARRSQPGAVAEDGMVYGEYPPYTVLQTGAVSAEQVQRVARMARYWDLLVNSGRFGQSSKLLLQGESAFAAWAAFSDWLWQRSASTHALTPEVLLDAVFDYLTLDRALPADSVRSALLADYLASGARSNPRALRGLLPRREKTGANRAGASHTKALAQRQTRHQSLAASKIAP